MKNSLRAALPFAEAFERLLHPFAEVVLHDLESDEIVVILNPMSRRVVGDSSYLEQIDHETYDNVIGPYEKMNWDGRPMKSISIVLRGEKGNLEGFLCINLDVSHFKSASQMIQLFLKNQEVIPESSEKLFKDDQYEKLNVYVQNYCRKQQVSIDGLSRAEKKEIIRSLEKEGGLKGKNAANYIGRVLGVSRATVYNYLK